jgi:anti-sigma factor RsiW
MNDVRHTTTDELLALRDGEGTAFAKEHVAACEACARELFRLEQMRARLKALPTFVPPRDRWPGIAVTAKRERRARWMRSVAGLAAAAALTGLTFVALRPAPVNAAAEQAALDRAMVRSQALEQTLRALGPESRALNGDAAQAIAELEDRLSSLDAKLGEPGAWRGSPGRAADLWQERNGVLGALVDVHATRVAMAGL